MSIQIVPYSVEEFNKIPSLGVSDKEFHARRGEEFVLSTLRLILLEHKMHDTFGVQLLHNHFELKKGEKLVDLNNQATGWTLDDGDKLMGGEVVPTSWRIIKGQGLMPYEFEFKTLGGEKGIDLTDKKYQPFLKDFVSAIEAGDFDGCVGLATRGETPGGLEITQGRSNIFFPTGTFDAKGQEQITAGWYFNPKPTALSGLSGKEDGVEQRKCARFEGAEDHRGKQAGSQTSTNVAAENQVRACSLPHAEYSSGLSTGDAKNASVVHRVCTAGHRPEVHYISQPADSEGRMKSQQSVNAAEAAGDKHAADMLTRGCVLSLVGHVYGQGVDIAALEDAGIIMRGCCYDARHIPAPLDTSILAAPALVQQPIILSTCWGLHRAPVDSEVFQRDCYGPRGVHESQQVSEQSEVINHRCVNIGPHVVRVEKASNEPGVVHRVCSGHTIVRPEEGVTKRICLELCRHRVDGTDSHGQNNAGETQRLCLDHDGAPAPAKSVNKIDGKPATQDSLITATYWGLHKSEPKEANMQQNGATDEVVRRTCWGLHKQQQPEDGVTRRTCWGLHKQQPEEGITRRTCWGLHKTQPEEQSEDDVTRRTCWGLHKQPPSEASAAKPAVEHKWCAVNTHNARNGSNTINVAPGTVEKRECWIPTHQTN
ncbi:hypothetical protein OHC33_008694 [Knufia fluminis]|uniref:Uncharacterized protein n=1 Tax=Knufia fluminis TaxID=191047 RepID=A0AAN8I5B9_9EURO|nr:hypothetical protein OHC33_008694 [Knufia fluminis]